MSARATHRRAEVAGLIAYAAFSGVLLARVVTAADAWTIAAAVLAGWLAADLVSGVVHWLADRYGSMETWWFGENFVRSFREHHRDPQAITRHDFVETNGDSSLVVAPVLALACALPSSARFWSAFALVFGAAVVLTSQVHRWAHMESPPALVRWLQRRGLILARDRHWRHHTAPFDTHYCITSGWLNPLLDRAALFRHLERWLERASGLKPQ